MIDDQLTWPTGTYIHVSRITCLCICFFFIYSGLTTCWRDHSNTVQKVMLKRRSLIIKTNLRRASSTLYGDWRLLATPPALPSRSRDVMTHDVACTSSDRPTATQVSPSRRFQPVLLAQYPHLALSALLLDTGYFHNERAMIIQLVILVY